MATRMVAQVRACATISFLLPVCALAQWDDGLLKPYVMDPRTMRLNPDPNAILTESGPCSERDVPHVVKSY